MRDVFWSRTALSVLRNDDESYPATCKRKVERTYARDAAKDI
jgi:hypothetical protein